MLTTVARLGLVRPASRSRIARSERSAACASCASVRPDFSRMRQRLPIRRISVSLDRDVIGLVRHFKMHRKET